MQAVYSACWTACWTACLTTCWSVFVCCLLFVVVVVVVVVGRKERSPHSIYTNSRSTALRLLLVALIKNSGAEKKTSSLCSVRPEAQLDVNVKLTRPKF